MKKVPTYFAFQTNLTKNALFDRLPEAIREYNSRYPSDFQALLYKVPKGKQNRFRIGVERAGHSQGGYWYCATVEETDHCCHITGNIVFNPDENDISQGPEETLWGKVQAVLLFVLLLIPIILIGIGFRIYAWIRHIPKELSKEEKLAIFMTKYLFCHPTEQQ